jgi:UDP-N-acetylmuramoyl-tripeptide--D-alanyl-D-alanine ligase
MFKVKELIELFGKEKVFYTSEDVLIQSIEHDTRRIKPNSLYVAIRGTNFDGHDFVKDAVAKGAVACIVEKKITDVNITQIVVEDSIKAYGKLASYWRDKLNYPIIGVTGSNGKTTTKDILYSVFSTKKRTVRTDGNFNNLIGVPYTLLSFPLDAEVGIVEMGMNAAGEIKELSYIAKPNVAIITNIGRAHIGLLGSIQKIFSAKMELMDFVLKNNGSICVNLSDKLLFKWFTSNPPRTNFITYAVNDEKLNAKILARSLGFKDGAEHFSITMNDGSVFNAQIPLMGEHNVINACSAVSAGLLLGLDIKDCIRGVMDVKASKLRSTIIEKQGVIYFVDCYNANPDSMKASIISVSEYKNSGRKIAVLGDMLELESLSSELHREIGEFVADKKFDALFIYGNYSNDYMNGYLSSGGNKSTVFTYAVAEIDKMKKDINSYLKTGDIVVVKGSRGMKLESILQD